MMMGRTYLSKDLRELSPLKGGQGQLVYSGWWGRRVDTETHVLGDSRDSHPCTAYLFPPCKRPSEAGFSRWCWENRNPPCCLSISPKINLIFFSPNLASQLLGLGSVQTKFVYSGNGPISKYPPSAPEWLQGKARPLFSLPASPSSHSLVGEGDSELIVQQDSTWVFISDGEKCLGRRPDGSFSL